MGGVSVGYVRVSSIDQNEDRQLAGLELQKLFIDKASGKDAHRPGLKSLMEFVREGDSVHVHSLDRLARNLTDLRGIVDALTAKGVEVHFCKEGLIFGRRASAMSHLLLSVMGAFAEFERALIRERQQEGIELAKTRGVYRGRVRSLNAKQQIELHRLADEGLSKAELGRRFQISRESVYRYLRMTTPKT